MAVTTISPEMLREIEATRPVYIEGVGPENAHSVGLATLYDPRIDIGVVRGLLDEDAVTQLSDAYGDSKKAEEILRDAVPGLSELVLEAIDFCRTIYGRLPRIDKKRGFRHYSPVESSSPLHVDIHKYGSLLPGVLTLCVTVEGSGIVSAEKPPTTITTRDTNTYNIRRLTQIYQHRANGQAGFVRSRAVLGVGDGYFMFNHPRQTIHEAEFTEGTTARVSHPFDLTAKF